MQVTQTAQRSRPHQEAEEVGAFVGEERSGPDKMFYRLGIYEIDCFYQQEKSLMHLLRSALFFLH